MEGKGPWDWGNENVSKLCVDVDNDDGELGTSYTMVWSPGDCGLNFDMKEAGNAADVEDSGLWNCRERNREESWSTADLDWDKNGTLGINGFWISLGLGDSVL